MYGDQVSPCKGLNDAANNVFCSRHASRTVCQVLLLMLRDRPLQERYETTYFAPFKVNGLMRLHNHAIHNDTLHDWETALASFSLQHDATPCCRASTSLATAAAAMRMATTGSQAAWTM